MWGVSTLRSKNFSYAISLDIRPKMLIGLAGLGRAALVGKTIDLGVAIKEFEGNCVITCNRQVNY
jgi:hypothetical protein